MRIFIFGLFFLILAIQTEYVYAKKKMSPEEILTRSKCTSCHTLPQKGKLTEKELFIKLNEHMSRISLSEEQKTQIVRFLGQ